MTTPPSRLPRPWDGEGEVLRVMALLRAEGGQDKPLVCMVATKDGRPTEAEAMVLPLPPDALAVNVARCHDAGCMNYLE